MEKDAPILLFTGQSGTLGHYMRQAFAGFETISIGRSPQDDIQADLRRDFAIPRLKATPEVCVHAAATTDPDLAEETNIIGTRHLLNALENHPPRHFVYISCTSVYGLTEGELLSETAAAQPCGTVAASKIKAEKMVWEWCAKKEIKCTILRPAYMFGSGIGGWQEETFKAVSRGYFFLIRGSRSRISVVTALDVAAVVRKIYTVGGIFNVADPRARTFEDLIEAMGRNSGKIKTVFRLPLKWARILAKAGNVFRPISIIMDSKKLDFRTRTLTFDVSRLQNAINHEFYDTIEVIARRDKNYPYEET